MSKSIVWTKHAEQNLIDREIERPVAERTIREPEQITPDPPGRQIHMRRYSDALLHKEMLLRIVLAETDTAITVITLYKTSQIGRYFKEG
ncbi:MAG: DUF4258 domain-containing protein [Chloroflexi bacterium]|nr:DUF4258 domain-containing protein [Chloroflexota bacterium]